MDFSLTDEQKMVQQTVRQFVERELLPLESEMMQARASIPQVLNRPATMHYK